MSDHCSQGSLVLTHSLSVDCHQINSFIFHLHGSNIDLTLMCYRSIDYFIICAFIAEEEIIGDFNYMSVNSSPVHHVLFSSSFWVVSQPEGVKWGITLEATLYWIIFVLK